MTERETDKQREVQEYLEPDEARLLEKTATCLRDQLLFRLLRVLGCRISEVLALREEDFNFRRHRVSIIHLKASIKLACPHCGGRLARVHTFCPGCGKAVEQAVKQKQERKKQRQLPVDVVTLHLVRDYLDKGGGLERDGSRYLFGISRQRAWQIFQEYSEKLGLPRLLNPESGIVHNVSPHKMRDSFAVRAMKMDSSGDGVRLLQEHLGHQSFDTTARYRKVSGEEQEKWRDKLFGEEED